MPPACIAAALAVALIASMHSATSHAACQSNAEIVAPYVKDLASLDSNRRVAAAKALGEMGESARHALPELLERYRDPEAAFAVRQAIARITSARSSSIVQTFIELDEDEVLRDVALEEAMGPMLRVRSRKGMLPDAIAGVLQLARALGPRAEPLVPDIVAIVKDPNSKGSSLVRHACLALAHVGPEGSSALRELLAKADAPLRDDILEAVATSPQAASSLVSELQATLGAETDWTRKSAVLALGLARPVQARTVDLLAARLRDPEEDVRMAAMDALASMGQDAEPAVPVLSLFLLIPEQRELLNPREALLQLGRHARSALPALTQTIGDDESWGEVAQNHEILATFGEACIPGLIAMLASREPKDRQMAAEALGIMPRLAHSARPALEALQADEVEAVREAAAGALEDIRDSEAFDLAELETSLASKDMKSRFRTGKLIDQLPIPRMLEALPLLKRCIEETDFAGDCIEAAGWMGSDAAPLVPLIAKRMSRRSSRIDAIAAVTRLGPVAQAAAPALCSILGNSDMGQEDSLAVMRALGELGPSASVAIPRLEDLLASDDWRVAASASDALWRIRGK